MIIEITSLLAILIGGVALMQSCGIRGWPLPFVGFIVGIALSIIIGTIQVLTGLMTSSVITLALTALLPLGWWYWCRYRGMDLNIHLAPFFITIILFVLMIVLFRQVGLTSFTPDSFYYVMIGSLFNSNNISEAHPLTLHLRLLAVPLMHAPANMAGEFYLRAITPLLAISTALSLTWFCQESLRNRMNNVWMIRLFALIGFSLLLTINRFVYHAFYINGHMLNAALILFIVGGSWLLAIKAHIPKRALLTLIFIAIMALAVTRPEASIFAALGLLPLLFSWSVPWKHRTILLAVLGLSITAWHGFLWFEYTRAGLPVEASVTWMIVLGLAAIIFSPLLAWRRLEKISHQLLIIIEIGLWLALAFMVFTNTSMFYRSSVAIVHNVFLNYGGWGVSLAVLGLLVLGVLVLTNFPNRIFLRFPLTTFIPVALLLAYLRSGAYRVGYGDSLNRMLIHFVPLIILFIVSAAASERWDLPEWFKKSMFRLKAVFPSFLVRRMVWTYGKENLK